MSKFIIQVHGTVYGSTSSFRAYQFTKAALASGHSITRVFFYLDGVSNTSSLVSPASDEFDLVGAWATLAKEQDIELVNCVSAALRRGKLSQQDACESGKVTWNVEPPFVMGGLGELVTGIETSERLVRF